MARDGEQRTLGGVATARLEARRSVFLATAGPVASEAAWRERVEDWRAAHRGCNHVAWGLRLRDGTERASDDGEPSGTAGLPCLRALQAAELVDAGVAVARRFGGVLLGRGGLIRAYGGAARQAVAAALAEYGAVALEARDRVEVGVDFRDWPAVERWLRSEAPAMSVAVEGVRFAEHVAALVSIPATEEAHRALGDRLRDLTSGRAAIEAPRPQTPRP